MKYLILGLMVLYSIIGCQQKIKENKEELMTAPVSNDFDWLLGNWVRSNEEEGKQTYENWVKLSDHEYQGLGFTMKERDTIWKENMILIEASNTWSLKVSQKDQSLPTIFMLTEIEKSSFTCENEENEFPKKIVYSISDTGLAAVVSGGDMEISFDFESVNMN